MRTLRVCLSSELPDSVNRDNDYIYLLYDKLLLFLGKNPYYDPYVITDSFPEKPISGCLYILFDGTVQAYIGDEVVTIAEIEDESQAEHLEDIGTTFFIMADKRYLDLQYRRLQLPYHNGTYSLNVSMAHDIKINENSVIRYDGKAQRFYLDGDHDILPRMWPFTGKNTKSAKTLIENHCVHTDVRVSQDSRNMIQVTPKGLFVNMEKYASNEDYATLVEEYSVYKEETDKILADLEGTIVSGEEAVSEDNIWNLILKALSEYSDNIEAMIEYYDSVGKQLTAISDNSREYTDDVFNKSKQYIDECIEDLGTVVWGTFDSDSNSISLTSLEYEDEETTEGTSSTETISVDDDSDNIEETSDESTDTTSEDDEEEEITSSDEEDNDDSTEEDSSVSEDGTESSDSTSE